MNNFSSSSIKKVSNSLHLRRCILISIALCSVIGQAIHAEDIPHENSDWTNSLEDLKQEIKTDSGWTNSLEDLKQEIKTDSDWTNSLEDLKQEIKTDSDWTNSLEDLKQEIKTDSDRTKSLEDLKQEIKTDVETGENTQSLDLPPEISKENLLKIRDKRSPFESRRTCSVSEDQLRGLLRQVKNTLADIGTVSTTNCDIDAFADRCDETLRLIQCGVNHLDRGYAQAGRNSDDYVIKYKNTFDSLSEKFYRQIDDVKRSVTQDQQRKIDSLLTQLHDKERELNSRTTRIRTVTKQFIASEIASGRISSAMDAFKELGDHSALPTIIRSTFNTYGGVTVFNKLIDFITKLPSSTGCKLDLAAFQALYDVMKENNNLNSPLMIVFPATIARYVGPVCTGNALSPVKQMVSADVENVLNTWVTNIRNGHYSDITDFSRSNSYSFGWVVKDLIEKAHGDKFPHLTNILYFIDGLDLEPKTKAYSALYHSVKRAPHGINGHEFITLIYRIKITLDRSDLTSRQRKILDEIKDQVPRGIMALLWDSFIYIKSKKHPENYLALHSWPGSGRAAFSRSPAKPVTCPESVPVARKWRVEVYYNGCIKFINVDDGGTLYDSLVEVTPVEDGEYYYFTINGKTLDSNNAMGWTAGFGGLSSDCSEPHLYEYYLGSDYHKWRMY